MCNWDKCYDGRFTSGFIDDDADQSTRLQLGMHVFDGPRLWRLGDTKGYANQTLVVQGLLHWVIC